MDPATLRQLRLARFGPQSQQEQVAVAPDQPLREVASAVPDQPHLQAGVAPDQPLREVASAVPDQPHLQAGVAPDQPLLEVASAVPDQPHLQAAVAPDHSSQPDSSAALQSLQVSSLSRSTPALTPIQPIVFNFFNINGGKADKNVEFVDLPPFVKGLLSNLKLPNPRESIVKPEESADAFVDLTLTDPEDETPSLPKRRSASPSEAGPSKHRSLSPSEAGPSKHRSLSPSEAGPSKRRSLSPSEAGPSKRRPLSPVAGPSQERPLAEAAGRPPSPDFSFLRDFSSDEAEPLDDDDDDDFIPPSQMPKPRTLPNYSLRARELLQQARENQIRRLQEREAAAINPARNLHPNPAPNPVPIPAANAPVQDPDASKCKICLDRPYSALLACGHLFCVPCLETQKAMKRPCAICRKKFRKWRIVFG